METQMSVRQFHLPRLLQFKIGGKICTPNNYEIITTGEMPSRGTQAKNRKNIHKEKFNLQPN